MRAQGLSDDCGLLTQVAGDCKGGRLLHPHLRVPRSLRSAFERFRNVVRPILVTDNTSTIPSQAPLFLDLKGRRVTRFYVARCLKAFGARHGTRLTARVLRAVQHTLSLERNGGRSVHDALSRAQNHSPQVALRHYVRSGISASKVRTGWARAEREQCNDLFESLSPTDGAPAALQSESDVEQAVDDDGAGEHAVDHDYQGEGHVEDANAGAGDATHDMETVPGLHIVSDHVECPLCHKEIMRRHLNQHLGKNRCVKIARAQEKMCSLCATLLYDSAALSKHSGNRACKSRAEIMKSMPDAGAAIMAAASERLQLGRAEVMQKQRDLTTRALEILSRK